MKAAMGDSVELKDIFAGAMLFLPLMLLITLIICAYPALSLWLPRMMTR